MSNDYESFAPSSLCSATLREKGLPYPRTCPVHGLGCPGMNKEYLFESNVSQLKTDWKEDFIKLTYTEPKPGTIYTRRDAILWFVDEEIPGGHQITVMIQNQGNIKMVTSNETEYLKLLGELLS